MYVSCDGGCIPIPGLGLTPPLEAKELIRPEETPKVELLRGERVEPLEGGGARDHNLRHISEYEPPEGWLSTMWLGGSDAEGA